MGEEAKPTVLVVEDHQPTCHAMARLVSHAGYNGVCITSGEDALSYLDRAVPELIILDVMMPGIDGTEVLRRVREDPRTRDVPVVMCSAMGEPAFVEHLLAKGATDYWVKSRLDFAKLKDMIARHVGPPPDVAAT